MTWTELGVIETAARWHVGDRDEPLAHANGASLKGWGIARQQLPDL